MTLFEQTITDMLKGDYQGRLGIPLMVEAGEKHALDKMVSDGTSKGVIRAAWQYYLDDERMHQVGTIGVSQFLKHLNRYMYQARRKVEKPCSTASQPQSDASCENELTGGEKHRYCWEEVGQHKIGERCPRCGGRIVARLEMLRKRAGLIGTEPEPVAASVTVAAPDAPEPEPVAADLEVDFFDCDEDFK